MIRILNLFPGGDLLGRSFEIVFGEKAEIVRGPDIIWGGDIRRFHTEKGIYNGIIGGPPCQWASTALLLGLPTYKQPIDLIPEYVRVVNEACPDWLVMENIRQARKSPAIPAEWFPLSLRDWDCGGLTHRHRYFWVYPAFLALVPPKRPGKPEYSVLATSWKQRTSSNHKAFAGQEKISVIKAATLQGFPELAETFKEFGAPMAVKLLGNGVPKAMGMFIANIIKRQFYGG